MAEALTARRLALLAAWGAALSFVVVAASALLRLGTALDAGGNVSMRIPALLESGARLVHRASASGVGIVAFLAAIVAFTSRPVPRARLVAVVSILLLTAFLAALGRHTPGYRYIAVTLGNAVGGVALACAFVALRVQATPAGGGGDRSVSIAASLALALVLVQAGLGTAAGALRMHGSVALDPWHVSLGPAIAAIAVAAAAYHRRMPEAGSIRAWVFGLALAQMGLGILVAAADGGRGIPVAWAHAVLACALALALTALAARGR